MVLNVWILSCCYLFQISLSPEFQENWMHMCASCPGKLYAHVCFCFFPFAFAQCAALEMLVMTPLCRVPAMQDVLVVS